MFWDKVSGVYDLFENEIYETVMQVAGSDVMKEKAMEMKQLLYSPYDERWRQSTYRNCSLRR